MNRYDVAVIGGGPAGSMAAIRAGELGARVIVLERNETLGKKLLLTGNGRCNVTNNAPIEVFIKKFGPHGRFLRHAFHTFSNQDLITLLESNGCRLKVEGEGRVFPVSDKARSILDCLNRLCQNADVTLETQSRVGAVKAKKNGFELAVTEHERIFSRTAIIATGGCSYPQTGSTGDGLRLARTLGHTVTALHPGLVPLFTKESWVQEVQGVTLKNIHLYVGTGMMKFSSGPGDLLFTHFGVSGPLILDASSIIIAHIDERGSLPLAIDCIPGLNREELDRRLVRDFAARGGRTLTAVLREFVPRKLIPLVIRLGEVDPGKKTDTVSRAERLRLIRALKGLKLTLVGSLGIDNAMVTSGGVKTSEIDRQTMESKREPGIYFCGEVIDGCAPSGGYNLQQAFSTGYCAGEHAAFRAQK
ncbi:MAG: NAD(P)/FAD-dependent oxidoreductase [Candidatus Omnitrophica bacterium]|nr:NAD(P)/FAD-dependent oxidoreductase [Candidatus Omnitrophota bacterium]